MKRPSILAPGGNIEMARASLQAGADAVYVGLYGWSRRTKEYELKLEEIEKVVEVAKKYNGEVRVAINTNFSPLEYSMFKETVKNLDKIGVKGVILTDTASVNITKSTTSLEVHLSAGANAINVEDMKFYKEIGVDMVVAPCNLTPEEVKQIKNEVDIKIEVFLHSNTCFTYLGKCLFSSYFKYKWVEDEYGKNHFHGSPNRGGYCHRICKARWMVDEKRVNLRNDMFLAFNNLKEWIESDVDCLKIQGREYNPELIAEIVEFYKSVINEICTYRDLINKDKYIKWLNELSTKRDLEREKRTKRVLKEVFAA